MGTSSSYSGPVSGVIPSWLDDSNDYSDNGNSNQEGQENVSDGSDSSGNQETDSSGEAEKAQSAKEPSIAPALQPAKSNYTRFAKTGNQAALGRAIKGYNASSGGSSGSAIRMGSSTGTASGVASFANAFSSGGAETALKSFNLEALSGKPAIEVLEALADQICPDGGTIDEAVARDAMLEALDEFSKEDLGDFENISPELLGAFLAEVMSRSIVTKVINNIGFGSLHGTQSDTDFVQAQEELKGYTDGTVKDALGAKFDAGKTMSQAEIEKCMRDVYADSFELLEAILEVES